MTATYPAPTVDHLTINGSGTTGDLSAASAVAAGASAARTLSARFQDCYSIEDFGVIDDPAGVHVAANTTAYNAALVAAAGVARLRHRAGLTVFINASLTPPDRTVWEFDGLIKLAPNAGTLFSAVHAWGNGGLYGSGTFDGNASAQTGTVVSGGMTQGDGKSNLRVSGITFQNFKNWPWNITNMSDVIAYDCTFTTSGSSVEYAATGDDVWFIHCTVTNVDDLGIGMYGGITSGGVVGCWVTGCSGGGVFAFNDAGQTTPPKNILIEGNFTSGNGGAGHAAGILVANNLGSGPNPSQITIQGNKSFANTGPGIGLYASADCSIQNNQTYQNCTTATNISGTGAIADIFLSSSTLRTLVTGNQILNPGGGTAASYGIYSQDAQQVLISANNTQDNRGSQLMISGIGGELANHSFVDGNYWGSGTGAGDSATYIQSSTVGQNYDVKSGASTLAVTGASSLQTVSVTGSAVFYSGLTSTEPINVQGSANNIAINGSTATNPVTLTAFGSDANIGISLVPKGSGSAVVAGAFGVTGSAVFYSGLTSTEPINVQGSANSIAINGSTATNPVTLTAFGSDANINININPKGSGSATVAGAFGVTGSAVFYSGLTATMPIDILGSANNLALSGSTATNPVTLTAFGSDANIGISLVPKGTGAVILSGSAPASSSAAGVAGSIAWDTGFIYICTSANTWKRAALSTF